MYRDLIEDVQKVEVNGRVWYYQQFNTWDGNLKYVNLFDSEGEFVCEFPDEKMLFEFIEKVE